jgi:transcriptional regulator with XRE-family HTH domain
VKDALKTLQLTQKALSRRLGITQAKISQWLNKYKIAEPEMILAQMISFLEEEETNIRTTTNIGSSTEHATYRKEGSSSSSSRREPQPTTVQRPNAGATTTPPPPAMTATPNAPPTDTSSKDLNNEPGLQGGFANGRDGKSIEQVDMIQDMNAMTDDGLI